MICEVKVKEKIIFLNKTCMENENFRIEEISSPVPNTSIVCIKSLISLLFLVLMFFRNNLSLDLISVCLSTRAAVKLHLLKQKHRKRVLNYTARKSSAPTTLKDPFYVESRHRPIKAV